MTAKIDNLELLDEHLVCATVSGRKRLGILGIVALPDSNGESKNHAFFYDFAQTEGEPLMPVGAIQSAQDLSEAFGPWSSFFDAQTDFPAWADQIKTDLPITPLSVARAYLCSTGKIQLPDSETLIKQTADQQSEGKPLGFGMNPELATAWFEWALMEDEISRNYSRARKQLSQAIADSANKT